MTELFSDGFESGDFNAWTGTGTWGGATEPTVETGTPHHGSYHAQFVSGDADDASWIYKTISEQDVVYFRGYFKWSANPPSNAESERMLVLRGAGYQVMAGIRNNVGTLQWKLRYLKNGSLVTATNDADLQANTWYCIEVYFKAHATEGAVAMYVNGSEIFGDSDFDSDDQGSVIEVRIAQDWSSAGYAHSLYVDCVVIADFYIGPETALKTVADAFSVSDAVLGHKTLSLADSLGFEDLLYGDKALLIGDGASLSESVTVIIGEAIKHVVDLVNADDLVAVLKTVKAADTVTLADVTLTPSRVLLALDVVGLANDSVVNKVLQVNEAVGLAEVVQVGFGGVKKTRLFLILGDLAVQLTGD